MSDVHEQGRSYKHGKAYEDAVEVLLQCAGFEIVRRHWRQPTIDLEIDLVVRHRTTGEELWIECKGSWEADSPNRNGACRTDSVLKLIGAAWLITQLPERDRKPYVLVTSHAPESNATRTWLDKAHPLMITNVLVTDIVEWKTGIPAAKLFHQNQPLAFVIESRPA